MGRSHPHFFKTGPNLGGAVTAGSGRLQAGSAELTPEPPGSEGKYARPDQQQAHDRRPQHVQPDALEEDAHHDLDVVMHRRQQDEVTQCGGHGFRGTKAPDSSSMGDNSMMTMRPTCARLFTTVEMARPKPAVLNT